MARRSPRPIMYMPRDARDAKVNEAQPKTAEEIFAEKIAALEAELRVLKPDGVLVFKWSEHQVPLKDILALTDEKPLIGERRSKTHWMIFIKGGAGTE